MFIETPKRHVASEANSTYTNIVVSTWNISTLHDSYINCFWKPSSKRTSECMKRWAKRVHWSSGLQPAPPGIVNISATYVVDLLNIKKNVASNTEKHTLRLNYYTNMHSRFLRLDYSKSLKQGQTICNTPFYSCIISIYYLSFDSTKVPLKEN